MVDPAIEGPRLYKLLYNDYDFNFGGSVVGISGAQGSVKTTVCLDLAEKKIRHHKDEKIFWRETIKSPMQCQRLLNASYEIYVEEGMDVGFMEALTQREIPQKKTYFSTVEELYDMAKDGVVNVPFFKSNKQWTELIDVCNMHGFNWSTIFLDEMEGLYEAGTNNQTEDKWWDWVAYSGHVIKECRKSHTSVVGNYHDENLIDHRVKGKFMVFLYGFGAIVNAQRSRVNQSMVDGCKRGEFCIALGRNRFGKIRIETFYPAIENCIIPFLKY